MTTLTAAETDFPEDHMTAEKQQALIDRTALENPCEQTSDEYTHWVAGVVLGVYNRPQPKDAIPAMLEGYEWGIEFNKEWEIDEIRF